jgi:hypothetical protein
MIGTYPRCRGGQRRPLVLGQRFEGAPHLVGGNLEIGH